MATAFLSPQFHSRKPCVTTPPPGRKGERKLLTFQVLSHQTEAPAAVGIISNPSGAVRTTPNLAALPQCVLTLGRIWGQGAAERCAWGAATPAASPTEGLGLTCKADLSHRAPLPHTTTAGTSLVPAASPPTPVQSPQRRAADSLGTWEGLCLHLVSHRSPGLLHTALV